ncbi:MAG: HD domain-containing protein [Candidatus Peribacteraceae bacterium]|nr:HD domain-containing protein [Candidatus Peribacteraceae bacterium]
MQKPFLIDRGSHLERQSACLQPYAVPHDEAQGLGRAHQEIPDKDEGLRFAIDRSRVTFSEFFRRLGDKVQVMPVQRPDYVPGSRLSHTYEVAALSRDIASELGVNADLAETIGLMHDLGHCGLGHEGERPVHAWAKEQSDGAIGFDHNAQAHRIVTLLTDHMSPETMGTYGLNLNTESVEGLLVKDMPYNDRDKPERSPSLEAQIVEQADDIAYLARDTEDALQLGIIKKQHLVTHTFFHEVIARADGWYANIRSRIIAALKYLLKQATQQKIKNMHIESIDQVYVASEQIVRLPEEAAVCMEAFRQTLYNTMYQGVHKRDFSDASEDVMRALAENYYARPNTTIEFYAFKAQANEDHCPRVRATCDYIARMTYQQVLQTAKAIGVQEREITALRSIEWK